jgi:hypothetical protein
MIEKFAEYLRRVLPCMRENTESLAEGCSRNGTGLLADMSSADAAIVSAERVLIDEGQALLDYFDGLCTTKPPGYFQGQHYVG